MVFIFSQSLIKKSSLCYYYPVVLLLSWNKFSAGKTYSIESRLPQTKASSIKHLHFSTWSFSLGTNILSRSTINVAAVTGISTHQWDSEYHDWNRNARLLYIMLRILHLIPCKYCCYLMFFINLLYNYVKSMLLRILCQKNFTSNDVVS